MCDSFNTDGYKQGCEQKLWGGYTQLILKKWIRYSAIDAGWSIGEEVRTAQMGWLAVLQLV